MINYIKLISLIGKFLPEVAALFLKSGVGIPGIGLTILQMIAKAFDADANEPDKMAEKIQKDPEACLKFNEFKIQNNTELVKLEMQAIKNSQDREIELAKLGKSNWIIPALLSVSILGLSILIFLFLNSHDIQLRQFLFQPISLFSVIILWGAKHVL